MCNPQAVLSRYCLEFLIHQSQVECFRNIPQQRLSVIMACTDCLKGYVRTDKQPTGITQIVYGLPTYIAQPPPSQRAKGVVVIVPDAFGWEFVNNRILADTYAQAGFRVYLPDFMLGVPVPLYFLSSMERLTSFSSISDVITKPLDLFWAIRGIAPFMWYNLPAYSHPRVVQFLEKLRASPLNDDQSLKIVTAGFCWGGKHVIMLTHKHEAHLTDGVFTAHPSALTLPQDIENVRKSLSIAVGTKDSWLDPKQTKMVAETLKRLEKEVPDMQSEVVTYDGADHGFSVRIDIKNAKQFEQAQEAEKQAIDWFNRLTI